MDNTTPSSELIALCGKIRDESISAEEFEQLEKLLISEPESLHFYRQFVTVCSGLEQISQTEIQLSQGVDHDYDAGFDWTHDLEKLTPVSEFVDRTTSEPKPEPTKQRYRAATIIGIAASLAAMLLFAMVSIRGSRSGDGFAKVVDSYQAVWDHDGPSGRMIGDYTLLSGATRIRFDSGAELLVQAPSAFSIDDAGLASLDRGSLRLFVPPAATGFQIQTPYGLVVDHGTRIGVFAHADLGLEVHVFEGKAEAIRKSNKMSASQNSDATPSINQVSGEMLVAGEAIAIPVARSVASKRMPANEIHFADAKSDFSDLPVVSGDIELQVSPPRAVRRINSELVDLGHATLFPERTGVVLEEDLPVSLIKPGKAKQLETLDEIVPAGSHVDTMLVHFAVPTAQRRGDEWLNAIGEIRFPRPIVGVICERPGKQADLLGSPDTDYPRDRDSGLEDSVDGDTRMADQIEVSDDRMTLRFSLKVHGRAAAEHEDFLDQLRILIQAAP